MTKRKAPEDHLTDGRPSKYRKEYNDLVYKYCLLGATDKQLANFFDVSEKTINTWKHKHPKFLQSTKHGKISADSNVAEALYKRSLGYSHMEEKIFCNGGEVIRAETIKHYPPDVTAASLWLRNRQPALWRDKTEVAHTNDRPLRDASEEDMLEEMQQLIDKKRSLVDDEIVPEKPKLLN